MQAPPLGAALTLCDEGNSGVLSVECLQGNAALKARQINLDVGNVTVSHPTTTIHDSARHLQQELEETEVMTGGHHLSVVRRLLSLIFHMWRAAPEGRPDNRKVPSHCVVFIVQS